MRTRRLALPIALLMAASSSVRGQASRRLSPMDLDTMVVARGERHAYGRDSLQYGELRLPEGSGPFPLAVVIHGGCWLARIGPYQPTPQLMAPLSEALRQTGVATWNVEYRSVGHPGGGWPGSFLDIGAAVDHARELARRFPIDTARVVTIGHSAGGQLAFWAAARHRLPDTSALHMRAPLGLAGAISIGGPGDMLDFARYDRTICGQPITARLFGVFPDTALTALAPRAHEASPAELLPFGVPHLLIVGTEDGVVPARSAEAYVARARAAGDAASYVAVPAAGHFDLLSPSSEGWGTVRDATLQLVARKR